nr:Allatostatin [Moritella viscosa]
MFLVLFLRAGDFSFGLRDVGFCTGLAFGLRGAFVPLISLLKANQNPSNA